MSMTKRESQDLDNHITGHGGEDQLRDERMTWTGEDIEVRAELQYVETGDGGGSTVNVTVLRLNDWPVGVYTTKKKAEAAALLDWKRREPRWKEEKLKFGQTWSTSTGNYHRWHYYTDTFKIDAEVGR